MADRKTSYTIQSSRLMLFIKYEEICLCGCREKCNSNYFVLLTTMQDDTAERHKTMDSDPYMSPVRNTGDIKCEISVLESMNVNNLQLITNDL